MGEVASGWAGAVERKRNFRRMEIQNRDNETRFYVEFWRLSNGILTVDETDFRRWNLASNHTENEVDRKIIETSQI